jgi:hypothetical protein
MRDSQRALARLDNERQPAEQLDAVEAERALTEHLPTRRKRGRHQSSRRRALAVVCEIASSAVHPPHPLTFFVRRIVPSRRAFVSRTRGRRPG